MSESVFKFKLERELPTWAKRQPKMGPVVRASSLESKQSTSKLPPLVRTTHEMQQISSSGIPVALNTRRSGLGSAAILAESSIWAMPADVDSIRSSSARHSSGDSLSSVRLQRKSKSSVIGQLLQAHTRGSEQESHSQVPLLQALLPSDDEQLQLYM
jgi:hypothetical protein